MKFSSKLAASVLFCLILAACGKSVEDKTTENGSNGSVGENANEAGRKLPECAKRNKDGLYENGHGCSAKEWVEWQDAR